MYYIHCIIIQCILYTHTHKHWIGKLGKKKNNRSFDVFSTEIYLCVCVYGLRAPEHFFSIMIVEHKRFSIRSLSPLKCDSSSSEFTQIKKQKEKSLDCRIKYFFFFRNLIGFSDLEVAIDFSLVYFYNGAFANRGLFARLENWLLDNKCCVVVPIRAELCATIP